MSLLFVKMVALQGSKLISMYNYLDREKHYSIISHFEHLILNIDNVHMTSLSSVSLQVYFGLFKFKQCASLGN